VALAQATIGVHMNEGSDVAQSAADDEVEFDASHRDLASIHHGKKARQLWTHKHDIGGRLGDIAAFVQHICRTSCGWGLCECQNSAPVCRAGGANQRIARGTGILEKIR
jgi:hypothetical protein